MAHKNKEQDKKELIRQISKTLLERRKAQRVDHKAVSQVLKIRVPFLEAMENGRWDELPGEVYLRGFLVKYAQYLGLNGKELIKPYEELQEQEEESVPGQTAEEKQPPLESSKMGWIWAGLIVLIFVGLVKFFTPDKKEIPKKQEMFTKQIPVKIEPSPIPKPVEHTIEIFTPESLWVRVQAENKTFEGFIPEGATWSWRGDGEFNIRLGHARQVALHFDGAPIVLAKNQKRVTLPREN